MQPYARKLITILSARRRERHVYWYHDAAPGGCGALLPPLEVSLPRSQRHHEGQRSRDAPARQNLSNRAGNDRVATTQQPRSPHTGRCTTWFLFSHRPSSYHVICGVLRRVSCVRLDLQGAVTQACGPPHPARGDNGGGCTAVARSWRGNAGCTRSSDCLDRRAGREERWRVPHSRPRVPITAPPGRCDGGAGANANQGWQQELQLTTRGGGAKGG